MLFDMLYTVEPRKSIRNCRKRFELFAPYHIYWQSEINSIKVSNINLLNSIF